MKTLICKAPIILIALLLHGCAAPLLVAGGAVGATLANDRREAAALIDDQSIEIRLRNLLKNEKSLAVDSHLSVISFNRVVLLTGQVRHQSQYDQIVALVQKEKGIQRLHNEIQVTAPISMGTRTQDTWITAKVKNALLNHADLNAIQVKVITEDGTVYLMGLVARSEGQVAAQAAQQVSDVKGVIKVFEYLD